jgi:hypothetical protein
MIISDPEFQTRTALTLPAGEVHLWHVELDAVAIAEPKWQRTLTGDELEPAKSFAFRGIGNILPRLAHYCAFCSRVTLSAIQKN